jgi:hypothetical protein
MGCELLRKESIGLMNPCGVNSHVESSTFKARTMIAPSLAIGYIIPTTQPHFIKL